MSKGGKSKGAVMLHYVFGLIVDLSGKTIVIQDMTSNNVVMLTFKTDADRKAVEAAMIQNRPFIFGYTDSNSLACIAEADFESAQPGEPGAIPLKDAMEIMTGMRKGGKKVVQ